MRAMPLHTSNRLNQLIELPLRHLPPLTVVGMVLLLVILGAVAGAPWLAQHDPDEQRPATRLQPPSHIHWLGTDRYGRDLFARVLYGGRTTLTASGLALAAVLVIGLSTGVAAGYVGGWTDAAIMRLVDVLLAFPSTILALVIVGLFGPGLTNLLLASVSVWWVPFARITRSIVLQVKNETSIEAACALGATPGVIVWREIVPRTLGPVLVLATLELTHLILVLAGLSFLGLGAQLPTAEWGAMLADGRAHMLTAPQLIIAPGLAIFMTALALNLIGEGLRDLFDPQGSDAGSRSR